MGNIIGPGGRKLDLAESKNNFRDILYKFEYSPENVNIKQATREVATEIRSFLDRGVVTPKEAVTEIYKFVSDGDLKSDANQICHRFLLFEALDICASYEIPDRELVREILGYLFSYRHVIDREVILCEFNRTEFVDADLPTILRKKREYMLQQISGWRLYTEGRNGLNTDGQLYIEFPLTRECNEEGETQIIMDALYRQADPEYVLAILRHGMPASCMHLWPITMSIDLRLAMRHQHANQSDVSTWTELKILRYYYRARSQFNLHVVLGDNKGISTLSSKYEDILLVSPAVKPYISADRYKNASSLQHLSRLAVRQQLLETDNLPRGIHQLGLPQSLTDYVDLLED